MNIAKLKLLLPSIGLLGVLVLSSGATLSSAPEKTKQGETANKSQETVLTSKVKQVFEDKSKKLSLDKIKDISSYNNVPIADIKSYPKKDSQGTVVLIPQSHKSPGSSNNDSVNDKPVKAQKQIYKILEHLNSSFGLNHILAEGKLENEGEKEKVSSMRKLKKLRDELVANMEDLKKNTQQTNPEVINELNHFVKKIDRKLYLAGAPYLLKTKNSSIQVVGVEDKELRKQSKEIVRNYLYQQDRIKELEGSSTNNKLALMSKKKKIIQLMELLKDNGNDSQEEIPLALTKIKQKAKSKDNREAQDAAEKTKRSYNKIKAFYNKKQQESRLKNQKRQAPSREDNPYDNIDDLSKLNQIHQKTKDKINDVVKNGRNVAIAENSKEFLENTNETHGILVFGAQHERGLIKELNKQNLNVVVVTPEIMK